MKVKLSILKLLHHLICIFSICYSLQACMFIQYKDVTCDRLCITGVVILLSFAGYEFLHGFWKYLLFQTATGIIAVVFSGELLFATVLAFCICITLQLIESKNSYMALMEPGMGFSWLFLLLYFLALSTDRQALKSFLPYAFMAYIPVMVLYINQTGLEDFLFVRQNTGGIGRERMYRVNSVFMLGLCLCFGGIFILSGYFMDDSLIIMLTELIMQGIRALFKAALSGESSAGGGNEYLPYEAETSVGEEVLEGFGKHFEVSDLAYLIVGTILALALVFLAFRAVLSIIRLIIKNLSKKEEAVLEDDNTQDEVISIAPERKERLSGRTPSDRIRIMYRKTILRGRRKRGLGIVEAYYTPKEIEDDTFSERKSEELHRIYEKARYARDGADAEDEKRLKGALGRWRI